MKVFFWLIIIFPLAVLAEDMNYFDPNTGQIVEKTNDVGSNPVSVETGTGNQDLLPANPAHKTWGKGFIQEVEKVITAPLHHTDSKPSSQLSPEYFQKQLDAKEQEIVQLRQKILKTKDGEHIQSLAGTLHRLEGEIQRIAQDLKKSMDKPLATEPTTALGHKPLPAHITDEEALKIQLERLEKEEEELSYQVKATPDAPTLHALASQLQRAQQNKRLVLMSLKEVQHRTLEHSPGFGMLVLPPSGPEDINPIPSLTPSLEQVAPPVIAPWPEGWGRGGAEPDKPALEKPPAVPAGVPVTGDAWKQVHAEAAGALVTKQKKDVHTVYDAPDVPLWTPKELGTARKSVAPHAHINHRKIVETIRKEKLF